MNLIAEVIEHFELEDPIHIGISMLVKLVTAVAVNEAKIERESNNYMIQDTSEEYAEDIQEATKEIERYRAFYATLCELLEISVAIDGKEFGCNVLEAIKDLASRPGSAPSNDRQVNDRLVASSNGAAQEPKTPAPSNDRQITPKPGAPFNSGEPWKFDFAPEVLVDLMRIICEHGHEDFAELQARLRNRTGSEFQAAQIKGVISGWKMKTKSGLSLIERFDGLTPAEREPELKRFLAALYKRRGAERFASQ